MSAIDQLNNMTPEEMGAIITSGIILISTAWCIRQVIKMFR